MENTEIKKKDGKNIIIVLLIVIIAILTTLLVLFATNTITLNTNNNNKENSESKVEYQVYSKGQTITLSDNSKWLVLADSDKNNDVVKLMSIDGFVVGTKTEYWSCETSTTDSKIYCKDDASSTAISHEYFNTTITSYKGTYIDSLVSSFADKIPVRLKEVDNYKIRLLSINDLMEYDNNWRKENEERYVYTGNSFNEEFAKVFLMDPTPVEGQCNNNCGRFFAVGTELEDWNNPSSKIIYAITPGYSGIPTMKPVIYAYKDSI